MDECAIEIIDFELVVHVVKVGHDKVVIDESHVINYIFLLRQDCPPVFLGRLFGVDGDDASSGSVQVGIEVEDGAEVADKAVSCVGIVQETDERLCPGHRAVVNTILWVGAVIDVEDEVLSIFGY